jgi:hypothetical protein
MFETPESKDLYSDSIVRLSDNVETPYSDFNELEPDQKESYASHQTENNEQINDELYKYQPTHIDPPIEPTYPREPHVDPTIIPNPIAPTYPHVDPIPVTHVDPNTNPTPIAPTYPIDPTTNPTPIAPTYHPIDPNTNPNPIAPTYPPIVPTHVTHVDPTTNPTPITPTYPIDPTTNPIAPTYPHVDPTPVTHVDPTTNPIAPVYPRVDSTYPNNIEPYQINSQVNQIQKPYETSQFQPMDKNKMNEMMDRYLPKTNL